MLSLKFVELKKGTDCSAPARISFFPLTEVPVDRVVSLVNPLHAVPFLEHPPTPAQKRGLTTLSPTHTPSTADTTTPVDRAVCPLFWNAPSQCLSMSGDFHASG